MVIGVSGGLELDARADRRGQGLRPARPAAQDDPRLHHAGLRHGRGDQGQCLEADAGAGDRGGRDRHPPRRPADAGGHGATPSPGASRSTTSTFENVQAGLRTDYLFRLANQRGGFVVGTGDLSELALGWCTYGVGDQMSHYAVNSGIPKTLIQYLIRWTIQTGQFDARANAVLEAILATRISPELVPQGEEEELQSTEDRIGPYELHDFFLFHTMRYGLPPSKVAFLAWHAWRDSGGGPLADRFSGRVQASVRAGRDPQMARGVPLALLRLQPVQALGAAERPQGLGRRFAVAARRLARPLRCNRDGVAGRTAVFRSGSRDPLCAPRPIRPDRSRPLRHLRGPCSGRRLLYQNRNF